MATDIAFALGALTLIAPAIPVGAKVFLTALAIVDDMGAVAVIALLYTHAIDWTALTLAALTLGALIGLNVARVGRLVPYLLLGAALWVFVHASGLHSTVAGVLLAFTIPTRTRTSAESFSREARMLLDDFERTETGDFAVLTSKGQQDAVFSLLRASAEVTAPLLRLEHALRLFRLRRDAAVRLRQRRRQHQRVGARLEGSPRRRAGAGSQKITRHHGRRVPP